MPEPGFIRLITTWMINMGRGSTAKSSLKTTKSHVSSNLVYNSYHFWNDKWSIYKQHFYIMWYIIVDYDCKIVDTYLWK